MSDRSCRSSEDGGSLTISGDLDLHNASLTFSGSPLAAKPGVMKGCGAATLVKEDPLAVASSFNPHRDPNLWEAQMSQNIFNVMSLVGLEQFNSVLL